MATEESAAWLFRAITLATTAACQPPTTTSSAPPDEWLAVAAGGRWIRAVRADAALAGPACQRRHPIQGVVVRRRGSHLRLGTARGGVRRPGTGSPRRGFAPRTLAEVWGERYIDRRYGRAVLRDLLSAGSTAMILERLEVGETELLTAWRADPSTREASRPE